MTLTSTRDAASTATLSEAIARGLAPDGGLYVPPAMPRTSPLDFDGLEALPEIAARLLRPFFAGDPLEPELAAICAEALDVPAPVVPIDRAPGAASVLELFHGPTSAFKDFGARFLAACLARTHRNSRATGGQGPPDRAKLTMLVATSGDTGGAVAAAFFGRSWADVALLYPKGLVSARQAQQLACWGGNVRTFAVQGTFDDCQRVVKEAMLDPALSRVRTLSSANSINIGRLLPQMSYYAAASLAIFRRESRRPNFIVPTGNLGNAVACVWAREMGLPIGRIVLATNRNRTIVDYLERGDWRPRQSVATLASAMDVGNPSNMERLNALFPGVENLRGHVTAHSVTDDEIRATIGRDAAELDRVWCPHSAAAAHVYRTVRAEDPDAHWVIVATAHPAKFNDIVEPLVGREVPIPPALERLLSLPRSEEDLIPTLDALRGRLEATG
ncbi:MAG TPA: threonine synthase [Vicinamibacterales bacterium]|nr:threonine synthase [Vicinamibacterales bacterium]